MYLALAKAGSTPFQICARDLHVLDIDRVRKGEGGRSRLAAAGAVGGKAVSLRPCIYLEACKKKVSVLIIPAQCH